MPFIKSNHIPGEQTSHESGNGSCSTTEKKVGMIGHEGPGITFDLHIGTKILEPLDKVFTIPITQENFPTFYPPYHDMMEYPGGI